MRKIALIFIVASLLIACNDNKKEGQKEAESITTTEQEDGLVVLNGEFIYLNEAAVLKGDSFLYAVEQDSMMRVLDKQAKVLKRDKFDMIPVEVKASVKPNPVKGGWEQIIEIKEIIKVSPPTQEGVIKVKAN
ncbi:hypothetical protein ACFSQ0_09935 [Mesonia sediminis]|uniref:NlpE C-terminal OB domain-containing protein n=1 Tax=Mesonia sediminis TaxID=1703946 RepID=A0ABW5SGL6_9FLAO